MINASSILQMCSEDLLKDLQNFQKETFEEVLSFDVECETLIPFPAGKHGSDKIFYQLHNFKNDHPAVYWFEISSSHTAKDIRDAYPGIQSCAGARKTPSIYKGQTFESKVLYVGKGKKNISGRMFLHFGFEPKKLNLQGLQLCHWDFNTALKGLKLKLHIIYLPKEMVHFIAIFERCLADNLKPILGRHQ